MTDHIQDDSGVTAATIEASESPPWEEMLVTTFKLSMLARQRVVAITRSRIRRGRAKGCSAMSALVRLVARDP